MSRNFPYKYLVCITYFDSKYLSENQLNSHSENEKNKTKEKRKKGKNLLPSLNLHHISAHKFHRNFESCRDVGHFQMRREFVVSQNSG